MSQNLHNEDKTILFPFFTNTAIRHVDTTPAWFSLRRSEGLRNGHKTKDITHGTERHGQQKLRAIVNQIKTELLKKKAKKKSTTDQYQLGLNCCLVVHRQL